MRRARNEATLEQRLSQMLRTVFPDPGLDVACQETFVVRLGRVDRTVGSKATWATGRADILLTSNGRPMAVVEVKAPGEPVGADAARQALSYARLVEPMAPLAVLTNGDETVVLRSFDGSPDDSPTFDAEAVAARFADAGRLAAASHDDAVATLLARGDGAFAEVLRSMGAAALAGMAGGLDDLVRPLCPEFSIPRAVVDDVAASVRSGGRVSVVLGPALSGRTNVLAQLCARDDVDVAYVDASSALHGPIRYLANALSKGLFRQMDDEAVRRWLLHRLGRVGGRPLAIAIDGWGAGGSHRAQEDLAELMQLCADDGIRLVVALNEPQFEAMAVGATGRETEFGRAATVFPVEPLSDAELAAAGETMLNLRHVYLPRGSRYNADYRQPRILRSILSGFQERPPTFDERGERMAAFRLPMTGPGLIDDVWSRSTTLQTRDDFLRLAEAAIAGPPPSRESPDVALLMTDVGAVSLSVAERELGQPRLDRLVDAGLASYLSLPDGGRVLQPRLPEVLAKAAAVAIGRRIAAKQVRSERRARKAAARMIALCADFPLPDVVGASALKEVAERDPPALPWLVGALLADEPTLDVLRAGHRVGLKAEDGGIVDVVLPEGAEGVMLGDALPYLVLSHFVAYPMAMDAPGDVNVLIASRVGAFPHFLLRIDERLSSRVEVRTHSPEPGLTLVCPSVGIVEPLANAMTQFLQSPMLAEASGDLMSEMVGAVVGTPVGEPGRTALALRLWTVFDELSSSVDEALAASALACKGAVEELLVDRR